MISTSISSTSDYYSGSDLDYDDDDNNYNHEQVVKGAPQHHVYLTNQTNNILQTLLHLHLHLHLQPQLSSTNISSTIKLQQSLTLFKLMQQYHLSNEVFIRAHTLLHKFLLITTANDLDESILIACLSLSTKLTHHSTHPSLTLLTSDALISYENIICNTLDWDIDMITPVNYVEALLLHLVDRSMKDRLRQLTYELIVLCLTDVRCVDISNASLGLSCLLMASELLECCEIVWKEVLIEIDQGKHLFEASLIDMRQVLIGVLHC